MVRLMTKPSGTKRAAVIFAINYTNTSAALKGCINDGNRTKDHVSHYEHVEMLSDNTATKPTRANMLAKMENLARMSTSEGYTNFVIHYSGHGVSVADRNGDEGDHKDEAWYSIDKQLILDDEIRAILNKFSPWSTVMLAKQRHSMSRAWCQMLSTAGLSGTPPACCQTCASSPMFAQDRARRRWIRLT